MASVTNGRGLCRDTTRRTPAVARRAGIGAIAWLLSSIVVVQAQDAPRLNPTGRMLELESPVLAGGVAIGSLLVRIDADDSVSVESEPLIDLLEPRLQARAIETLRASERDGRLPLEALDAAGIEGRFDIGTLSLDLVIPAALRRRQVLSLRSEVREIALSDQPAAVSGYANLFGTASRSRRGEDSEAEARYALDVESAVRLGGPVLAFEAAAESGDDVDSTGLERLGTRLLIDLPERSTRVEIGDVFARGRSFQSSEDLLGIRIGREFTLTPGVNVRPAGRSEFTLERRSTVEIRRDGESLRTLDLEPGAYDLQDLALTAGLNAIELVITDESGRIETILFDALFDTQLLAPGTFDYALAFGVAADTQSDGVEYLDDVPLLTGFVERGFDGGRTAGFNTQLTDGAGQVGLEVLQATPVGPVLLELAASSDGDLSGGAVGVAYSNIVASDNAARRYRLAASYESPDFSSIDRFLDEDATDSDDVRYRFDASFSQRVGDASSVSLGFSFSDSHDDTADDEITLSAGIGGLLGESRSFGWGLFTRLSEGSSTGEDVEVVATLSYRVDPFSGVRARAESDGTVEFSYGRQVDNRRAGGYAADVTLGLDEGESVVADAAYAYIGNRFRSEIRHDSLVTGEDEISRSDVTTLQFDTALAFAGTRFGIGRPIGNSFALVSAHPTLEDRIVRVEPDDERETARSGWLGAAVLPDLGLYQPRAVTFDVDDLPLGYDLGAGVFVVGPPLAGGYDLQVGSGAVVTVIGVLADEATGEPFALVSGFAYSIDDENFPPVQFFSNRTGKFAISGLAPGSYRLELDTTPVRSVTLDVPDDGETLLRPGTVAVP